MRKISIARDDGLSQTFADTARELDLLAAVDHVFGRAAAQNPGKGL